MNYLRGFLRLLIIVLLLLPGAAVILLTAWIPIRWRGVRLAAWVTTGLCRLFMAVFNIHYHCPEPEKVRRLPGFLFPNHSTYLDIIMLSYLLPVRYVAKAEIRNYPLIGMMARAIGCIFVDRQNKASRRQARQVLAQIERYPPIVLFPEGRTGSGATLQPFRHGAFEIAVQNQTPFLPCMLLYDRPEIVRWMGDPFTRAIWRLASRPGPLHAHLIPLSVVRPRQRDDATQLVEQTYQQMAAALAEAEARIVIGRPTNQE
jgi:1-acyl-sn-glycerol-3-phosphate acyltransferase